MLAPFLFVLLWADHAPREFLWQEPGEIEKLDLGGDVGTGVPAPSPPFRFEREDLSGTQPKIYVHDARGTLWDVKFGAEVKPESFCWRILRACGYCAEPNYYVREGKIEGLRPIRRKTAALSADGQFHDARFQWRSRSLQFLPGRAWSWDHDPFLGTPELNGLKVLLMLMSNFDNKDSRVGAKGGPNTGVFRTAHGRLWFAFTDWGSAMGRWGDRKGQTAWRCDHFTAQSADFIQGEESGRVRFGYQGHVPRFNDGITTADLAWLLRTLGRIQDDQLRAALRASGATTEEEECFTKALRSRIEALRNASPH